MALTDDFESYSVGTDLTNTTDWLCHQVSGSGVMRIDTHTDHRAGRVVDMSAVGHQIAVHQTALAGSDHDVSIRSFLDDLAATENKHGVLLRLAGSDPAATTGYEVRWERLDSPALRVRIYRHDNGVVTQLAESGDLQADHPITTGQPDDTIVVRGTIVGTVITAYLDGTERLSYDTASDGTKHTTGTYTGVRQHREVSAANSQPFFDQFEADTIGASPDRTGTAAATLPAPSASADGTVTNPPGNTGAAAATLPAATASGTGAVTNPPAGGSSFTDDFNRADNTDLGADWTPINGALQIINNAAAHTVAGFNFERLNSFTPNADCYIEVLIGSKASTAVIAHLVLRADATWTNGYHLDVQAENQNWRIYRQVSGSFTSLASVSQSWSAGDVVRFEVEGNTLRGLRNGVEVISATDATYAAAGETHLGIYRGASGLPGDLTYDSVTAGNLGVSSDVTGTAAATLPTLTASASGAHATPGAAAVTLPNPTVAATGTHVAPDAGTIDVWYGATQNFGDRGVPANYVNILGNVSSANTITGLSYTLNGGSSVPLSIGADGRRLQWDGDFNIDLAVADLSPGANTVVITLATPGGSAQTTVTVNWTAGVTGTLPVTVDWDGQANLNDVAQVVDGKWAVSGTGVRTIETGYDRLINIGDRTWSDYEITFDFTVHDLDTRGQNGESSPNSGSPLFGVITRWTGHTDNPVSGWQPKSGWVPNGNIAMWSESSVKLYSPSGTTTSFTPALNTLHHFRCQSDGVVTRVKMWEDGQTEPNWQATVTEDPDNSPLGSVLLVAHHVDMTFENVTISALSAATGAVAVALPSPAVVVAGMVTAPEFTGTAIVALPAPTTAAAGAVANPPGNAGPAAATLPTPTVAASGTRTIPPRTGAATVTLPAVTSTASGTVDNPGFSGTASTTLPISSVAASGIYEPPSSGGTAAATLPLPTVTASGTRTIPPRTGTAALTLPAPTVSGFSVFPAAPDKRTMSITRPARTITISRPARTVEVG